eukprot:166675_1
MSAESELKEWISVSIIGLITLIINCWILRKECEKRISQDVKFISKSLKMWPLFTIIASIIWALFVFVQYFPIFCNIRTHMQVLGIQWQGAGMGFYQLSRLYYCFSQTKVHPNKGYSNVLFIVMYFIGISFAVDSVIYPWVVAQTFHDCGINNKYQYFANDTQLPDIQLFKFWTNTSLALYLLWDITTLALYTMKVLSFRKYKSQQPVVYQRIMSILSRVLILTVLYEIATVLFMVVSLIYSNNDRFIVYVFFWISYVLLIISETVAIYLMQEHNTNEYRQFLKLLYNIKMHHICCCCKSTIIYELESNTKEIEAVITNVTDKTPKAEITNVDTCDQSIKQTHSHMTQISIETTIN